MILSSAILAAALLPQGKTQLSIPRLPIPSINSKAEGPVSGLLLVKFKKSAADQLAIRAKQTPSLVQRVDGIQMRYRTQLNNSGWVMYEIPSLVNAKRLAEYIKKTDRTVVDAQPVNRVHALIAEPNDPDFNAEERREEYILNFTEEDQFFRVCWHFDEVDALSAWSVWPNQYYTAANKPTNTPLIAVLDSGCDMDHPDFRNAGGVGTNTTQGGQLDKAKSVKIRLGQVVPGGSPTDGNGHGTHVTGIALASANNGAFDGHGTLGTGYACKGMIINVLDANGSGLDSDVAVAIMHAADQGADIINLSLGGENYSQVLQDAVVYATEKGSVVVCAGNEDGNGGGDLGPIFPAACSGALGVTANGPDYLHASFAGYGYYVDLGAPGGDFKQEGGLGGDFVLKLQFIWSTGTTYSNYIIENQLASPPYTQNYTYLPGTSMATPLVSGALGMYMAKNNIRQGDWNNIRVYRAAERSAYSQGAPFGGYELSNGYGAFNFLGLMEDSDERFAEIGGAEGVVYFGGTPVGNVVVRARKWDAETNTFSGVTYSTTTTVNGIYRFDGMPAGQYRVWAAPFGSTKDMYINVVPGSDRSGVDLYGGTAVVDTDGPIVQRCNITSAADTGISVNHFAYDPETRLEDVRFEIQTATGNTVVVPQRRILFESAVEIMNFPSALTPGSYKLVATYVNGEGFSTVRNVPFTVGPSTVPVTGTITLNSYSTSNNRALTFQLRTPGTTTVIESHNVNCANGSTFTLNTTQRGSFDIAVKGAHFLRDKIANVNITNAGVTGLSLTLRNGDVNGDNSVGGSDFNALRAAYGSVSGNATWNPMADLNGDGSVGATDFNILRSNWGQIGIP